MVAVVNKLAPDLFRSACFAAAGDRSVSSLASRGGCGGGARLEVAFVLWIRRRGTVGSGGAVDPRSPVRSIPSTTVLAAMFLQVRAVVFAVVAELTAGWNRAVCPTDASSLLLKSRRLRRVDLAVIPTRRRPLQAPSGDPAVVRRCSGVPSGAVARPLRVTADRAVCRKVKGLGCNFLFLQGPFCNFVTAVPALELSCTLVFLS